MILRIDPALADEVKRHLGDGYFTTAIEEGLALWLKRAKRRAADPLAKHLAPPTARERNVRRRGMTERNFICPVTEAPCDNDRCFRDHCRAQL